MGRFDNYRFHCSSLGKIMTDPRSGTGLSETCKAHLMECWIAETYGREKVFENKYMTKGTEVEENAITLYSRAKKKFFKKNTGVLSNEFIIGTPDTYDVADVIDIKSSWDIFTFFANIFKPLNKDYAWQLSGYRTLLKKLRALLVYCLVDTPGHLIEMEKNQLRWKMGVIDDEAHPLYLEACEKIENNMTFDDIPLDKRYMEFEIPIEDYPIEAAYERIIVCRKFLNDLG